MKKNKQIKIEKLMTFQQKLEADTLKKFLVITIAGFVLTFVCSVVFYFVNIYATLQTERNKIEKSYFQLKTTVSQKLIENTKGVTLDFLNGASSERELYTDFYNMMNLDKKVIKGRLLVYDASFNVAFDSAKESSKPNKLTSYLRTVFSNKGNSEAIAERVYLSQDKVHYLVLSQEVTKNGQLKGFVSLLIEGNSFQPDASLAGVHYYLYDKFDNVFSMSTSYFLEGNLEKLSPELKSGFISNKGELVIIDRKELSETVDLLVLKQENSFKFIFIVLFASTMILLVLTTIPIRTVAKKFAGNNSKNVEMISYEMEKVGADSSYRFKIESGDEFEDLGKNINKMLNRIDSLHQNNLDLLETNAISERKKLEAQFDPHFLYNTLETIRIASQYDPKLANDMILSLNVLLRYSISKTVSSAKIRDDLNYLKHYFHIYEIRFENLKYSIVMSEKLGDLEIPKLLLLPIIENSLKYGLMQRDDLTILIEIKRFENEDVLLSVADNGGGISQDIVRQVNDSSYQNEGNHHGLNNSKRRFLLAFPNSNFTLFSEFNESAVIMEIKKEDLNHV